LIFKDSVIKKICGVDEAGRGPIAGPVTSAAVILSPNFSVEILDDSKKLSPLQRKKRAKIIKEKALAWAVGWTWPAEIDKINIHYATLLAMKRAICNLTIKPDIVYIDGKFVPAIDIICHAVVRGDTYIPCIQAASIIAKTTRDLWMERFARIEPQYLFEKHKGYPTLQHRELIKLHGLSVIHRRSFQINLS